MATLLSIARPMAAGTVSLAAFAKVDPQYLQHSLLPATWRSSSGMFNSGYIRSGSLAAKGSLFHPYLAELPNTWQMRLRIHAAMAAIWHLRPATQRRFPLHRRQPCDWLRYLAWCATDGRKEYKILREIPDWNASWNEAYICASCHDEVHAGRMVIEGYVMTTDGLVLEHHKVDRSVIEGGGVVPLE